MTQAQSRAIRQEVERFFCLTFFPDNSIYESHCDFSESQISIREKKFNGCKESCCEEKGCSEKEEVVIRVIRDAQPINTKTAPATEPFLFWSLR